MISILNVMCDSNAHSMPDHKKMTEIAGTGNGTPKRITNWLHIYDINVSIKLKLMRSREYEMITKKSRKFCARILL